MKIRIIIVLLGFIASVGQVRAQGFEWIRSEQVNYPFNPQYPEFPVCFNASTGQVVHSRFQNYSMIYGQYVLATNFLESRDSLGDVIWTVELGDSALVQRIVTDPQGNIYAGGVFQGTLHINGTDSLTYFQAPFVVLNTFLLKFDAQGTLLWKKNITVSWGMYEGIQAMTVDPSGKCWYAMTDFFIAKIIQLDNAGNDVTIRTINNGKQIGNISFDPWGGMYVSGAATLGNFIMDADTFNVIHQYSMFIARYNPQGKGVWAHFGYDITFQRPMITTDPSGNVFFAGTRFDTTSFNGTFFIQPYLNQDFFCFKMDTSGTVLWAMQQPALGIGPYGYFLPGSNLITASDSSGKFYLAGIQQGPVDWGNGFVSATPMIMDRKIGIACISPTGSVLWEKMGGGSSSNYVHALTVTPGGTCYFTGSFRDTAVFDTIVINTINDYNFLLGKINPILTSGAGEISESNVMLYPNPSSGTIHVSGIQEPVMLEIFNTTGQLLMAEKDFRDRELDLRHFSAGLYFVQFRSPGKIFNYRLNIMK